MSTDIRAPLRIEPNYLSEPSDMEALCAGAQESIELGRSKDLSRWYSDTPYMAPSGKAELRDFIKANVDSYRHPVGTCAMGMDNDAVVDARLRVRGIENLRIADNSIMPSIVTGHVLAATLVIAEKAADMIAADRP